MPSTLVSSVLDITLTAWMEDKLFFKMYKRGKLMMKKFFLLWRVFVDVDILSTAQSEAVERVTRSQVMEHIIDKECEAMYELLWSHIGKQKKSLEGEVLDLTTLWYKMVEMEHIVFVR
jgi:hypothetical protein